MKNNFKKILVLVLILTMVLAFAACGNKEEVPGIKTITKEVNTVEGELAGMTVILHTNDVHGAIEGYSYLPNVKKAIEAEGATVILVDDGDYTNGNIYVSISQGESAVTLMNQAGYDIAGFGNHEFDFGLDKLKSNLKAATFTPICANVLDKKGNPVFNPAAVVKVGELKIGFFGLLTPETQTKVNPAYVQGLTFTEKDALYAVAKAQVEALAGNDLVIALTHLGVDDESTGNRSLDVAQNVEGIDFIIDGHSHTVYSEGNIQQTGTEFANVGYIVIDNATKKIVENGFFDAEDLAYYGQDADVLATAKNVIATVDEEFGAKFAETSFVLEGTKEIVRSVETNLGDLVADSLVWSATNEAKLEVKAENVVAITNGGGIRATIEVGDITRSSIKSVLPFGNTVAVNYVTGAELLEVLEASTFAVPESLGGFPQIAGMKITIDSTVEYKAGEEYPDSTYTKPLEIGRVTIDEVNGKAFDPEATYAVVTNNFCAAGGDTYYAFKRAYDAGKGFDTSIPMDEALVNYIKAVLGEKITDTYAEPQGRITIK